MISSVDEGRDGLRRLALVLVIVLVVGSYLLFVCWLLWKVIDVGENAALALILGVPAGFLLVAWAGTEIAYRRGVTWLKSPATRARPRYLEAIRTGRHLPWPDETGALLLAGKLIASRNTEFWRTGWFTLLALLQLLGGHTWFGTTFIVIAAVSLGRGILDRRIARRALSYQWQAANPQPG